MKTRIKGLKRGCRWGLIAGILLLTGCARGAGPEDVALNYARALYASDGARAYGLLSREDRRVKDKETFLRERDQPTGFALEAARKLASFIEATVVNRTSRGKQVTITLRLWLPDASAPQIATVVHQWDERRLNALSETEREQVMEKLTELYAARQLPAVEGEESFELVREGSGWRVFLNWAGAIRVYFRAAVDEAVPLHVTVNPEEVLAMPGERVRVSIRVENVHTREIVARVGHRIEPKRYAEFLALLQCPLFLPVTLKPGQTEEFPSEYMILKDIDDRTKRFQVMYEFVPSKQGEGFRSKSQ